MGWRVILTGFAGALVLLAVLLYLTPIFELREDQIEITGNPTLNTEEVLKLIRVRNGMKLARVRPESIVERLERHPAIRKATVKIRIPSGLRVEIQERRLWAIWHWRGLALQVSDDGKVLDVGYPKKTGSFVIVRDDRSASREAPVKIGMILDDLWGYPLAPYLARASVLAQVDKIYIDKQGVIVGRRGESAEVKLGKSTDIPGTTRMMERIPQPMWARFHSCRSAEYDIYGYVVVAGCRKESDKTGANDVAGQAGTHL
jgi:hypothetical protein